MCVMSMVHDHFGPLIPDWTKPFAPTPVVPMTPNPWPMVTPEQVIDYARLAEEFRKACAAARVIDAITGTPDCVDPKKEPLQARVAELERRLAALEAAQKTKARARRKTARRLTAT